MRESHVVVLRDVTQLKVSLLEKKLRKNLHYFSNSVISFKMFSQKTKLTCMNLTIQLGKIFKF